MVDATEEIADADLLYRRLAPSHVNPDGTVNSAAFKLRHAYDEQISVDLARLTTIEHVLVSRPAFGVGGLVAHIPRQLGFTVRHDPLLDNPAHSLITGANSRQKSRLLAEAVRVFRQPRHT